MIKITFPDGAIREFESGVTTFEIAQSISNSLAKKALAGKFNGKLIDTTRAITEDGSIEIVTPDHEDALPILRHSAAHLFAQAARRLFPDIHLGVGPAIEDGFYYDTDNQAGQISNEDLPRIEEEMKKIVKENFPSVREEVTKDEAREIFKNDPYKLELIEEHSEGGRFGCDQLMGRVGHGKGQRIHLDGRWSTHLRLLSVLQSIPICMDHF